MYEISGYESHGKTALMLELAGYAQRDGAAVAIWDLESSWDSEWARKRGLAPEKVVLFSPRIGTFGKEKEPRLITAQEHCEEIELWMKRRHERNSGGRIFLGVDAVAAILTEEEAAAGIQDQNMRTMVSLASFLSKLLRRWVALAINYNAMIVMVNQLRMAPGVRFGNPEYTPGGNAVRYYSAVRVRMRRKGGKLLKDGKVIGLKGILSNWKNKAGEGSREGAKIGFKLYYNGKSRYVPAEEIRPDPKEG